MTPDQTLAEALELMKAHRISGIPIVEKSGKLCGILTNRDVRFAENPRQPVSELMTRDNLATVPIGTSEAEARRILHQRRIEKLLVVDKRRSLRRPDHRQGHREVGRRAARDQGCRRAAAGRRGDDRRRCGLRALRGADRRGLRLHRDRHRPRPQPRRRRGGRAGERPLATRSRSSPAMSRPPTRRRRWSMPAPTRSRSASARARSARRGSSPASACRS